MAEIETKPTEASVDGYLAEITNEVQLKDCEVLIKLMSKATKLKPTMWGMT